MDGARSARVPTQYPTAYIELVQELTASLNGASHRAGTTLSLARISIRANARFNLVIGRSGDHKLHF